MAGWVGGKKKRRGEWDRVVLRSQSRKKGRKKKRKKTERKKYLGTTFLHKQIGLPTLTLPSPFSKHWPPSLYPFFFSPFFFLTIFHCVSLSLFICLFFLSVFSQFEHLCDAYERTLVNWTKLICKKERKKKKRKKRKKERIQPFVLAIFCIAFAFYFFVFYHHFEAYL